MKTRDPRPLDPLQFPFCDSQLIEASAGTGKTFTLALLYTRLVLGHGGEQAFPRSLTPPEILVVTYTKAATQELRERIRRRLVETAEVFAAGAEPAADPLLLALRADYPVEQWHGCARRLRLAAEWMDEAMIATIHGWCQRVLQEHSFATQGLFQREVSPDQTELIAEVLRDYWRVHVYPLNEERARSLVELIPNPEALHSALSAWLQQRGLAFCFHGHPLNAVDLHAALDRHGEVRKQRQIAAEREDAARQLWRAHQTDLEQRLWPLQPHLNGTKHQSSSEEKFTQTLQAIAAWSQGADAPKVLQNFAQGAFCFKAKATLQTEPEHAAFAALQHWQTALEELTAADTSGQPSPKACILAHARQWISQELTRRLHQQAELGYDDLLTELEHALDPASGPQALTLAATLRQRFPVALIDEFQDTDPVQYRIFERVYGRGRPESAAPTAWVMIGDPKQAIYGFRGADIHSYLAARQATEGRHHTLGTNYRATTAMVTACNHLFARAEQQPRGTFRFRTEQDDPIPFYAVKAQGRPEQLLLAGEPAPALTFWTLTDVEAIGATEYRLQMAEAAASQIVRWLKQARQGQAGFMLDGHLQALQPRDIAILVRSGHEAQLIRQALAARAITSVYWSNRESVLHSAEAHDLLIWLEACVQPTDERRVRAALGTTTLGVPLTTMAAWQTDELAWEEALGRFHDYQRLWQQRGVLAMLRQVLHDFALPQQCLAQENGERRLTNLLHLAEWLQQAARALDGQHALLRHLREHLDHTDEAHIVRLESDADLIKVITIHKAKGLEFPLVLLPFVCDWKDLKKNQPMPYQAAGTRYLELDPEYTEAHKQAEDARISEDLRLLYVALTRARHAVWLGMAPLKHGNNKTPQLQRSAIGHLLGEAAQGQASALWATLADLSQDCAAIAVEPLPSVDTRALAPLPHSRLDSARPPPQAPRPPWWMTSYSALRLGPAAPGLEPAESAREDTAREEADPDVSPASVVPPSTGHLHDLPRGPQIGTFLHGLLEDAADLHSGTQQGFAAAAADGIARRELVTRRCQFMHLENWIEPLDAWLADYLTRPWVLPDAAPLCLAELSRTQFYPELEFWFPSQQVDTARLDALALAHCLPGQRRPSLLPQQLNGMLKGYIDLVVQHEGRYYVLDWKSNALGADDAAYQPAAMQAAILSHRYDLQYLLYLLALHWQLQARLPDYCPQTHLGGAIYAFLRGSHAPGQGLYIDRPPVAVINALAQLFAGEAQESTL